MHYHYVNIIYRFYIYILRRPSSGTQCSPGSLQLQSKRPLDGSIERIHCLYTVNRCDLAVQKDCSSTQR